jgi:hypothetical protein
VFCAFAEHLVLFQEMAMLKGLRWPFLALILAGSLLLVAYLARPDDSSDKERAAAECRHHATQPYRPS